MAKFVYLFYKRFDILKQTKRSSGLFAGQYSALGDEINDNNSNLFVDTARECFRNVLASRVFFPSPTFVQKAHDIVEAALSFD